MKCLIHSPAFNNVAMAWVAGVGLAELRRRDVGHHLQRQVPLRPLDHLLDRGQPRLQAHLDGGRGQGLVPQPRCIEGREIKCRKHRVLDCFR